MFIVGQVVYVWEQGVYEESLYFLLNFVVKLKVLLKIKFIILKKTLAAG